MRDIQSYILFLGYVIVFGFAYSHAEMDHRTALFPQLLLVHVWFFNEIVRNIDSYCIQRKWKFPISVVINLFFLSHTTIGLQILKNDFRVSDRIHLKIKFFLYT